MARKQIIYLDQNKWIEIAQAVDNPSQFPEMFSLLEQLIAALDRDSIVIPLSSANVYETHKINDWARRSHLAWVQSTLSGGRVFRGRAAVLRVQITEFLSKALQIPFVSPLADWFLSDNPFEFAGEGLEQTMGQPIPSWLDSTIKQNPAAVLNRFLTDQPEERRRASVQKWSAESLELMSRMNARRALVQAEPKSMQRRAYCATLIIENLDFIFEVATDAGIPVSSTGDLSGSQWRAMIKQVGLFDVEVALATTIEFEDRTIDENDLRDVHSYTTAICFSDVVVGEKATINRAKQAKLGARHSVKLLTSLEDLSALLIQELQVS